MLLGAGFQVAAFATMPDFDDTGDRLQWIDEHAARADVSKVFDILAMPFLLGAVLVYLLLSRRRSPRLAYVGGALLGLGMVGLSMAQGFETLEFNLANDARFDLANLADAVDDVSTAPAIVLAVMFLGGAFFGLLVTAVALWRSRAVPRGAVVLMIVFIVTDIFLSEPLAGHAIALVAALWIASAVSTARAGAS